MPYLLLKLAYLSPGINDDTPTHILLLVLVLELLRYQSSFSAPPGDSAELPRNREIALSYLVTIATLGFLFKPMGAVSLGLTVALVVASAPVRRLVPGVVLPALLLTGYFARNIVLSGWLLFPAPVGGLAVDWAVPAQPLAEDTGHQLARWSRGPPESSGSRTGRIRRSKCTCRARETSAEMHPSPVLPTPSAS